MCGVSSCVHIDVFIFQRNITWLSMLVDPGMLGIWLSSSAWTALGCKKLSSFGLEMKQFSGGAVLTALSLWS